MNEVRAYLECKIYVPVEAFKRADKNRRIFFTDSVSSLPCIQKVNPGLTFFYLQQCVVIRAFSRLELFDFFYLRMDT